MKRVVETWSVEKLHKKRDSITFPEYQRQPNLWSDSKKSLLIDSILQDIDIPKLYFNRTEGLQYEVVDGQQRLWAIWGFLDDGYLYESGSTPVVFSNLTKEQRDQVRHYEFQVTVFDDADEDYLRKLFVRLQLGLLLLAGEKLNAATGKMKEYVFGPLMQRSFIKHLGIPRRRYAKETLGAQICINSFTRAKVGAFARTRYEDLEQFFVEYEDPKGKDLELFEERTEIIRDVLKTLWQACGDSSRYLRNRAYILSVYLVAEELHQKGKLRDVGDRKVLGSFMTKFWSELRGEIQAGFYRKNRELYEFETFLSSAPGERYQIERRHEKMLEYYEYFRETGKIKGEDR